MEEKIPRWGWIVGALLLLGAGWIIKKNLDEKNDPRKKADHPMSNRN